MQSQQTCIHNVQRLVFGNEQLTESLAGVACGASHTCAFATNGRVYTWGDGSQGQVRLLKGSTIIAHLTHAFSAGARIEGLVAAPRGRGWATEGPQCHGSVMWPRTHCCYDQSRHPLHLG